MTNSSRGIIGTIFTFIIGILVGFVLIIGGIAGGAYWAYNNLKLQKVNDYSNLEIIGADYLDSTVKDFVQEIIDMSKDPSGLTLGKLEDMFAIAGKTLTDKYPDGIIPIKLDSVTLVEIDLDYLRNLGVNDIGSGLTSAINFVATLDALSTVGITLPDFPLINGSEENPVDIYTLATEEETPFEVEKNYIDYEEFYSVNEYTLASDEFGTILDSCKYYSEFYYLDDTTYTLAVDTNEDGILIDDYPLITSFYVQKNNYTLVDASVIGTMPLYIKTNGIKVLPIIDSFNALSSSLNFDTMTLRDLENKLGVSLKDTEGEYSFIFESILDVPINKMSTQITEEIKNFELIDLIDDDGSTLIHSLLYQDDGTTPVKVGEVSARLSSLTLGGIVTINESSPPILKSLQNSTLNSLSADIDNLTLDDVMTPTGALANLIYKRDANGLIQAQDATFALLYYTDDTETATTTAVTIYPVYVKTKITEISGQIDFLTIGEFLTVDDTSSPILKALKDTQIADLAIKIESLSIQEIFKDDIYNGFEEIKANGNTLDYATYGFKNFYTDLAGTTKVDDVFNEGVFNNDYLNTVLYSEKVADGMWKFFVVDNGIEKEVKIIDMGTRMTQISENIKNADLDELQANNIISATTNLEATIPDQAQFTYRGSRIGDLTMEQLILSLSEILNYINSLGL